MDGVGLLDLTTSPQPKRTIGELVSRPLLEGLSEPLTGFENHRGGTVLGAATQPLGAVIRGATPHFDYVAGECAKGLTSVSMKFEIPVGFGVLTVDTIEQAIERAGTKAGNKGVDAALSAIEMINVMRQLEK